MAKQFSLDDLSLNSYTKSVVSKMGVSSAEEFMGLTKNKIKAEPGTLLYVWNDIKAHQMYLKYPFGQQIEENWKREIDHISKKLTKLERENEKLREELKAARKTIRLLKKVE